VKLKIFDLIFLLIYYYKIIYIEVNETKKKKRLLRKNIDEKKIDKKYRHVDHLHP